MYFFLFMELQKITEREMTFMHNSTYLPGRTISEKDAQFDSFLHKQGIPYLMRICSSVGIKVDRDEAGTMGVPHANIQIMAYNIFGIYYSRIKLSTYQEILDFSFKILGDRIELN